MMKSNGCSMPPADSRTVGSPAVTAPTHVNGAAASAAPTITKFHKGLSGHPLDIVAGPGRNLWFTEGGSGGRAMIGRITPSGRIRQFRKGLSGYLYAGSAITRGPDGNLWFTESGRGRGRFPTGIIGRITPAGRVTQFRRGVTGQLGDITAGPDGNVWFTQTSARHSSIGRITPRGAVRTVSAAISGELGGITTGPDGNVWFTRFSPRGSAALGRIAPSGATTLFDVPIDGFPADIVTADDDNLWFSEFGHIGMSSTTIIHPFNGPARPSKQDSFSIGKPLGYVHALAAGPDHNVWFAAQNETGFGKVGFVTPSGHVTRLRFRLGNGRGDFLDGIAAGADGNIWVTDTGRNAPSTIDRVNLKR